MAKVIYQLFYGIPLRRIMGYMIILTLLWLWIQIVVNKKTNRIILWKILNCLLAIGMVGVIGVVTLSARSGGERMLILVPFYSFVEAKIQPEMYRSMLMNVFLFFPLGLSLPFALPEKWKHQALWSILFAVLLSIGIEFSQYYYHLGRAEVDDILCNVLGCTIGSISYLFTKLKITNKI